MELMRDRLQKVLEGEEEMLRMIDLSTSDPSSARVQELAREIEAIQRGMEEGGPRGEQFEEEAIFSNDPEYITRLDPITSAKLGELEHAVIEQIELIDGKIQTGFRYTSYNKLLSKKMQYINNAIDSCIKNIDDSKI